MHDYIKERTIKIGKYIVETRKTVRVIAKEFGVSKSTVHKDLTERLPEINPDLANEVKEILDYHKSIRHLRGGEATKLKYKKEEFKPTHTPSIRRGDILIENELYGQYKGELQIALLDMENSGKTNVVGRIAEEEIFLLNELQPWDKFAFCER